MTPQRPRRAFAPAGPGAARSALALAGSALALAGCATVTRGTHAPFRIVSLPAGAQVRLSSGEACITPCTLVPVGAAPEGRGAESGQDR